MNKLIYFFPIFFMLFSCTDDASDGDVYNGFSNPELVTITGYSGDAMEPFISRDGNYLFFNNDSGSSTDKDLFYAIRINDTTFQYGGAISAINSDKVDGVPTIDSYSSFYYVSLVSYSPPEYYTIYSGTWSGSTVTGSTPVPGLTISALLVIYFDVDVSSDGTELYLSRGDFTSGTGIPSEADIVFAKASVSGFTVDSSSSVIMANVNTSSLEYAPTVSNDCLELFFTRADTGLSGTGIYRAVRNTRSGVFGVPQKVEAITGFVEGPALSPDGKSLYYHRLNTSSSIYEIYRVTR